MDEIRISYATDLPKELCEAWEQWKIEADRIIHSDRIQWYAKSVSTIFDMNGKRYKIVPADVFSPEIVELYCGQYMDNVLAAGLEILQGMIEKDLKRLGASYVQSFGFLD